MQWSNDKNNDEGTPIKWCNQHMNSAIVVAYYNKPSQKQQLLRNNFFPCITNLNEDSTTAILKNFGQRNLPPPNCLYSQQLYIETTSTQNTAWGGWDSVGILKTTLFGQQKHVIPAIIL